MYAMSILKGEETDSTDAGFGNAFVNETTSFTGVAVFEDLSYTKKSTIA